MIFEYYIQYFQTLLTHRDSSISSTLTRMENWRCMIIFIDHKIVCWTYWIEWKALYVRVLVCRWRDEFLSKVKKVGPKERGYARSIMIWEFSTRCTIPHKHRLFTWLLAFERYDRDGSGFLSKGEHMEAMKAAGMSVASAEASRFFQKIDKDNDDKISFKVFSGAIFSCSYTVYY